MGKKNNKEYTNGECKIKEQKNRKGKEKKVLGPIHMDTGTHENLCKQCCGAQSGSGSKRIVNCLLNLSWIQIRSKYRLRIWFWTKNLCENNYEPHYQQFHDYN